eukprot:g26501.t1
MQNGRNFKLQRSIQHRGCLSASSVALNSTCSLQELIILVEAILKLIQIQYPEGIFSHAFRRLAMKDLLWLSIEEYVAAATRDMPP